MRSAFLAAFAAAAAGGLASEARSEETTYHVCVVFGHGTSGSQMVAITEPFPYQGDGMARLENQFESFIYDVQRGRVQIGVDASIVRRGECFAGGTDRSGQVQHMQNRLRHAPGAVVFASPLDVMGMYRRAGSTVAAKPASKLAAPKPATEQRVRRDNPLGKTPNQVKYELATAVHQTRLARLAREKAELEAKKEQQRAVAREVLSQHDQALAQHRQVVAASDREQAEYRAKLAAPAKLPEGKIGFREGIVLCEKRPAPSKEWRCPGPLQVTYANLDDLPRAMVSLGEACGSSKSIRDLGMVSGYRAFGCGFGIHPTARDYPGNTDVPAQLGVNYIPDRGTYYCLRSKLAYCRG